MSIHYKRYLLLIVLAALMAALVIQTHTVAAAPAPPNDNFAYPQVLVLNTSVKTRNVDLATTEASEPVCGGAGAHSVWYRIVPPFNMTIALSTAGSYVEQGFFVDTVMCVYTGATLGTLTQVAASDDYSMYYAEIPQLAVAAGATYYVKVAQFSGSGEFPGAYYRMTTTVLGGGTLLQDGSFEINPLGSPWKIKNALNGDGRICGDGNALSGTCSIKLVGGLNESTKIQQKIVWPIDQMKAKTTHYLAAIIYTKSLSGLIKFDFGIKISYSDGTPTTKYYYWVSHNNTNYLSMAVPVMFASPNVTKVVYFVTNRSESSTLFVDDTSLFYAGGLLRDIPSGVLPVPVPIE